MKRLTKCCISIVLLTALVSLLCTLIPVRSEMTVQGRVRIPAANIHAEVLTASCTPSCGCCGIFWNGGVGFVDSDLSAISVDDTADLKTYDGGHLVMECFRIETCLLIGDTLIGLRGLIQANGNVILVSLDASTITRAYIFTIL